MGIMTVVKGNKALRLQKNGKFQEAEKLYEEAIAEGLNDPRYLLPYALMILRKGEYQKAKEFLVAHQKAPGMTPGQRTELLVYYATCCLRLGNVDKGISTLEQQFRKNETGLLYQTLGYMYVEKYDAAQQPDFAAEEAEAAESAAPAENEEEPGRGTAEEQAESTGAEPGAGEDENGAEKPLNPREAWEAGKAKAEAFIRSSVEYDDEDPICLDNMGQFLFRVREDRAAAKEWFEKAIALKPGQIDTLFFLSRYDLEEGKKKDALEKLQKAMEGRFSPLNYCNREDVQREIDALKGEL